MPGWYSRPAAEGYPNAMLRAVIFDMDGVLVDSYQAHFESWTTLAAGEGIHFDEPTFAAIGDLVVRSPAQ